MKLRAPYYKQRELENRRNTDRTKSIADFSRLGNTVEAKCSFCRELTKSAAPVRCSHNHWLYVCRTCFSEKVKVADKDKLGLSTISVTDCACHLEVALGLMNKSDEI